MRVYKVVVAEDEEIVLENIIKKINKSGQGFEVVGAALTGSKAFEIVKEMLPDLLLTDIKMPVMDGVELIKNVDVFYPHVKKVILSGYAEFSIVKKC